MYYQRVYCFGAMASDIIKCANCNVVINELLAFIQNKADVMDEISLTRMCSDSFTDDEIVTAKKLLFESVPNSKLKVRKSKGKSARDLDDIICLLKLTDPELVPIFVARDLRKLPPVTFDHIDVTKLLKDILVLQSEINILKNDCVTVNHLLELKAEIDNLKRPSIVHNNFVNRRRGAFVADLEDFDSGPMTKQQSNPGSNDKSHNSLSQSDIGDYFPKYVGAQKKLLSTPECVTVAQRTEGKADVTELSQSNAVALAQRLDSDASSSEQVPDRTIEQCITH